MFFTVIVPRQFHRLKWKVL